MKYLREWFMDDAEDLAEAINNKNVLKNLRDGIPFPYTVADAEDFLSATLSAMKGSQYSWAVHLNGKVIGSIGLFRGKNVHCLTAELGYYLAEPHWGKGIMSAAVKEACDYVFENTDIIRIFAEPFAFNAASCRVLEKSGFSCEGTLRKNALKSGQILDMKLYALIREA